MFIQSNRNGNYIIRNRTFFPNMKWNVNETVTFNGLEYWMFLKGLVARCHSFLFFYFYKNRTDIQCLYIYCSSSTLMFLSEIFSNLGTLLPPFMGGGGGGRPPLSRGVEEWSAALGLLPRKNHQPVCDDPGTMAELLCRSARTPSDDDLYRPNVTWSGSFPRVIFDLGPKAARSYSTADRKLLLRSELFQETLWIWIVTYLLCKKKCEPRKER